MGVVRWNAEKLDEVLEAVALLPRVRLLGEDLCVDEGIPHRLEIAALHRRAEKGDVETGVVGDKHRLTKKREKLRKHLGDLRAAGEHIRGYPGDLHRSLLQRDLRVHQRLKLPGDLTVTELNRPELDNAIMGGVESCSLEIERCEGEFRYRLTVIHRGRSYRNCPPPCNRLDRLSPEGRIISVRIMTIDELMREYDLGIDDIRYYRAYRIAESLLTYQEQPHALARRIWSGELEGEINNMADRYLEELSDERSRSLLDEAQLREIMGEARKLKRERRRR